MPQLGQQQIWIPQKGSPNPPGFTFPERHLIPRGDRDDTEAPLPARKRGTEQGPTIKSY